MSPEITVAIIGGACTVCAPLLTLIVKDRIDNARKLPISSGRRDAINGRWQSMVSQTEGPQAKPVEYSVTLSLNAGRRNISGTLELSHQLPKMRSPVYFVVDGGFYFDRYLQLNYQPKDKTAIQFGSILLELNSLGNEMEAKFVSYGALTESIVTGSATFSKVG